MDNTTTLGAFSSLGKSMTGIGSQVSDTVRRQQIGGDVGGSLYGLVWGELSNMLNTVLGLDISSTNPTFNNRMYGYMFRLMAINRFEKDLTLATIAQGAYMNGNPDGLPLSAMFPLYSNIVSDYPVFVRGAAANELNGIDTTRANIYEGSERFEPMNLYPDDLGIGTFDQISDAGFTLSGKWNLDNRNSILDKTKNLFEKGKINSLISRFGTKTDGESDVDFVGKVGYMDLGMSRGKNLRRAPNSGEYTVNGYNNPYCRVWTHHHQYDRYSRSLRPFVTEKAISVNTPFSPLPLIGIVGESRQQTMEKVHTWNNEFFKFKEDEDGEWGWKNNNKEWRHSVLNQQDGVVNITPKYDEKGTIHTKDCMFSIENLAWKDYDPYTFENALSWEQRGPLGGRIMWFPPYGISFTENTNVSWNESTFIGRGENVYTYSNTTRSGTLSFMMLTDHPSVTDYASWSSENSAKIDDDIWNRYFAGCDSLDGNDEYSIMHYVMPTPMDYIFETKEDTIQQKVNQDTPEEKAPEEEKPSDATEEVTFFVFFPNYYTGRESTLFDSDTTNSWEFSIAYLLGGLNAQKNSGDTDEYILFSSSEQSAFKRGYEMSLVESEGITDMSYPSNCIKGNKWNWRDMTMADMEGKTYEPDNDNKWYYRIDGRYVLPETNKGEEVFATQKKVNQYSHRYASSSYDSYKDTKSFGMNLDINAIDGDLCRSKDNLYSFAEVALGMAQYMGTCNGVVSYLGDKILEDRKDKVENLAKLFESNLESVEIIGYANSQGYSDENELLAENRGKTILSWINWYYGKTMDDVEVKRDKQVVTVGSQDENSKEAKKWRCAKCTLKFATDATQPNNRDNEEFEQVTDETVENVTKETGTTYDHFKNVLNNTGLTNDVIKPAYDNLFRSELPQSSNDKTQGKLSGKNKIRYDNEMFFYKKFQRDNPFKWKALSDKLQYFDPAFHSMTPEGFNMRLTFLEQCTRQGDTVSASDVANGTRVASNMAFGRPPFCVLRLGDFYNQLIVIKSITKNYDDNGALTWDLNDEGIGAQPMICHVTISFDFIGGGDLAGPVRRLQNAMSFNYYANASLYDNRADRMYYDAEENLSTKMGGAGNDKPSLPHKDENGNIIEKKGTYSEFHSIEKDDTDVLARARNTIANTFAKLPGSY